MTIEERLTALEKIVVDRILPMVANPAIPKYLSVSAIHFEDANGMSRGMIGLTEQGMVGLTMSDEKGTLRMVLNCGHGAPSLIITDEDGKHRIVLTVRKDGPALVFYNEDKNSSIVLNVSESGPGLSLFDKDGNRLPI